MSAPSYRPSHRVPHSGWLMLGLAALLALPLAGLYGWCTSSLPAIFDPVALCVACGGIGWLVRWAALRGKIRAPRFMAWAGAGIGLLAWHVQWAVWLVINRQAPAGVALATMLDALMGSFQEQTATLAGWGLVLCWIVECGAWIFLPSILGRRQARAPFCEASASWARRIEVPVQFAFIAQPEVLRAQLESDPARLEALLVPCADDFSGNHARLTIYRCAGPDSFVTLHNYVSMTPEQASLPADVRNGLTPSAAAVEYYGEVDEPIVELWRVPMPDPDGLLHRWEQAAARTEA